MKFNWRSATLLTKHLASNCQCFPRNVKYKVGVATNLRNRYYSDQKIDNVARNCNVGTIGHVDHGKTTLTSAITKYLSKSGNAKYVAYDEIDQAPEEQSRGITINIAHIGYRTKYRSYAHTDCPGHADYVKKMIAGASQMDGAIIVVAATDGQMPQTREHIFLCKQIGLKHLIVYINKVDLVDNDTVDLVEIEMRDLLQGYGYAGNDVPVIAGSALLAFEEDTSKYGEPSIQRLLDAMDSHIPVLERDTTSPFLVPIDNALPVPGRGTVVTGTVKRGTIKKQSHASLMGYGSSFKTAIADMQVFHKSVDEVKAGDCAGFLLRNVKLKDLRKGMVLCAERSIALCNHFEAAIYILTREEGGSGKPIRAKYTQPMFADTWFVMARIFLPENVDMVMPGENIMATLQLRFGMIILPGQQFTIREGGVHTVASGRVTKILDQVDINVNDFINKKKRVRSAQAA